MRLSGYYPRFYELDPLCRFLSPRFTFHKDKQGHYWIKFDKYMFTTEPPSRYEEDGPIRRFLAKRGM